MNRRSLNRFLLVAAMATTSALLPAGMAQAQTKLKWAHVYETSEPYHKWSLWAAEEFKKRTNGKYDIQVFPASTLGKESDLNQGLQLGTVDIILTGTSFASRAYPRLGVSNYPFTFRDVDHLLKYSRSDVFQDLTASYNKVTGNTIMAFMYYGVRQSTSNKAFKSCDEMKGLKIRVPDSPIYAAMPRACGANPTPIAFAEVYLALQNGTVDAQENPLPTIEAKKFFEVQKNIILTGHIADSLLTVVSPNTMKRLTPAEQKLFKEIAIKAAESTTEEIRKREAELLEEFRKRGLNIITVDRAEFQQRVLKTLDFGSMQFNRQDWDRIVSLK